MPQQAWYKNWFNSTFYHKLYFERDENEAKQFIQQLIVHLSPAAKSRMLDVACGKGRHSRILAAYDLLVTGIDLSSDSIAFAKQFEKENLDFFEHDMRLPFWGNYFDYAFNFFTSFGFFKTSREHDDAVCSIAKSLKPGGYFILDYLNTHYAEQRLVQNEVKHLNGTCYTIHRWDDASYFYKKIIITDTSLEQPLEFTEQVAKFSIGDFTDMFSYQGLQIKEVFGDYQLNPYNITKTPRLILIAQKTT